ncbi:MAG: aminopeptidase P family protein [Chloroflexi bacterium]|nr:aminopeptidase P family protein [Chloroflexota bacterium]
MPPEYYPRFSEAEYRRRYKLIRDEMDRRGLDCLIFYGAYRLHNQANSRYVCNWVDSFHCYTVFPAQGEPTLFNHIYPHTPVAQAMSCIADTRWGGNNMVLSVIQRVRELGLEKGNLGIVGVDSWRHTTMPVEHWNQFQRELPQARFQIVTEMMEQIRLIKSGEQIEHYRKGAAHADQVMHALVDAIRPGISEYELYSIIAGTAFRLGGEFPFALLGSTPMSNPDMPYPRPYPTTRRLQAGDVVLNEIVATYNGCGGQLMRPIAIGEPTPLYRQLYEVAKEAYLRIQAALKPGNTEQDVLKAAAIVKEAGFTIQAPVLHGWDTKFDRPMAGLPDEKEWPVMPFTVQEGMTLMIEVNPCTRDLKAGVFFGNLQLITDKGAVSMQEYPLEFVIR